MFCFFCLKSDIGQAVGNFFFATFKGSIPFYDKWLYGNKRTREISIKICTLLEVQTCARKLIWSRAEFFSNGHFGQLGNGAPWRNPWTSYYFGDFLLHAAMLREIKDRKQIFVQLTFQFILNCNSFNFFKNPIKTKSSEEMQVNNCPWKQNLHLDSFFLRLA